MNKLTSHKFSVALVIVSLLSSQSVVGQTDVAPSLETQSVAEPSVDAVESSTQFSEDEDPLSSNFIEFKGILGAAYQSSLYLGQEYNYLPVVALTIDAEYEGWFLESNSKNRINGVMGRLYAGYHIWESESEQLDLVWGHYSPAIERKDKDDDVIPALANLEPRHDDDLLGIRYASWIGKAYYSTEVGYDILNSTHKGIVLEAYVGKVEAVRNWDLTYGLGFTWFSAKVADYNLGVETHELTEYLTTYNSGAAYTFDFEFSAQVPISESWVLEVGVVHSVLSSNIKDSPLVVNGNLSSVLVGFSYVF
ncbi:MAG: MipA/OmpV family protein [Kangiellaceae bacterium]